MPLYSADFVCHFSGPDVTVSQIIEMKFLGQDRSQTSEPDVGGDPYADPYPCPASIRIVIQDPGS